MNRSVKLGLTVALLIAAGLTFTAFTDTNNVQLNSLHSNSDNPNETTIESYIPFLSSIETCDFGDYNRCIEDTYEYKDARAVSILAYQSYDNPGPDETLNYRCVDTGGAERKTYLLDRAIDDINNPVTDWFELEANGEEISPEGEIPFSEINDGYSILCLNRAESGTDWAANGVSLSNDGFDLTEPEPEITTYRETEVTPGKEQVEATVYLENTGSDMTQDYIVEMQPVQQQSLSFLSFVGQQDTCDPENPQNVNKPFRLDSGDRKSITLTSDELEAGTYDIKMVSTTSCAVNNPDASSVEPFGWGEIVSQDVFVQEINDPPTINSLNVPSTGDLGSSINVDVSASDPNNDDLSIEWSNGETGNTASYVFDSAGVKTVSVSVSDGQESVTESVSIEVVDTNTAPVINRVVAPESTVVGESFTVIAEAEDADGDELSYEWSNGDTGDTASYVFTSTGEKSLSVSVSDGVDSVSQSVTVDVVEEGDTGFFQKIINFFTGLFG